MKSRLGVTTCCWTKVGRTVVAVKIDEWMAQRERLSHANEGVIDGAITVWVITSHRVASNASAFYEWSIWTKPLLIHVPNNAAVHRLEAVTHIGQCARHDDRHRVIKERAFHFVLQLHWLHRVWVGKQVFLASRRFDGWRTSSSRRLLRHSFCWFAG